MATGRVNVGGGGSGLNIFAQLSEPAIKEGIWLKTSDKFRKVINDSELYTAGTWLTPEEMPYQFRQGALAQVGSDVFLFGSSDGAARRRAYKYDTVIGTFTRVRDIPYDFYQGAALAIGTDIYLLGGYYSNRVFKYDTLSDTYTRLADIPMYFYHGAAARVGTDIHFFSSDHDTSTRRRHYVYDTLTDSFTLEASTAIDFRNATAVSIGMGIYLFKGTEAYKYDTLSKEYTLLASIPTSFEYGTAVVVGADIYLLGIVDNYVYNTLDDSYRQIEQAPYVRSSAPYTLYGGTAIVDGRIYLFGGNPTSYVQIYNLVAKAYDEGTLIVFRSNEVFGDYYTELVTPLVPLQGDLNTRIVSGFNDVFLFVDGELTEPPAYYGDGKKWIQFKGAIQ